MGLSFVLALALLLQEPVAAPAWPSGVLVNQPGAAEGLVLFAPLRSRKTFLIDRLGEVQHTWESELPPLSVYLLDDGTLLRCGRVQENPTFNRGGRSGTIQRLAKDSSLVWEYVLCDENRSLHHDIEPLPNGNVLAIAWERLDREQALALGRDPEFTGTGWWPDSVLEIEPTLPKGGKIVWEWHAKDHLIQDLDPAKPNYGAVAEHPERIDVNAENRRVPVLSAEEQRLEEERRREMAALGYGDGDEPEGTADAPERAPAIRSDDWLHMNSVDYQPETDLVLLSTPTFNEIWIIDHSTTSAQARGSSGGRFGKGGDLLWRWGNPAHYGRGTKADQQLFFQHQAEWIPPGLPGAGHVTVFNNGMRRPGKEYSSIDELVLPFDPARGFQRAPERAFGPSAPLWSYSDPERFYSFFISGCQRLTNGNTFVCSGKQGRLFEVTPAKEIVWEYWNPYGGELERVFSNGGKDLSRPTSCFRATKLRPDHPGIAALGLAQ